jgi:RimJ/RimL family protein N-acetyltransferase
MECKLRPFTLADLESLVKYANNPKIAANLTNQFPHPYTLENGKTFIEMTLSHQPLRIHAISLDGEACGAIGIHPQTDVYCKNAELGYWLAEPFWGQGIITRAIEQIIPYAFSTFNITRIYARPFSTNMASQRVLEKAGFKKEAVLKNAFFKNGEYLDEMIYSITTPL